MDFKTTVTTFSYIEDEHGHKTITETVHDEVIQNPDGRHDILCAHCAFPDYPSCRKWCQNEEWWREKHPKEGAAFKEQWFKEHPDDVEPFPEDK